MKQILSAFCLLLLFICFGPSHCFSQTCGDFPARLLPYYSEKGITVFGGEEQEGAYEKSKYLVPCKIIIDSEKVMTLSAGSTIYFLKGSKMIIKGKFICQGTSAEPIVLSKLLNELYDDQPGSKTPTQWEGIYLESSAELELHHVIIDSSIYGITGSKKMKQIVLDSVLFRNNQVCDIRIGGKIFQSNPDHYETRKITPDDFNKTLKTKNPVNYPKVYWCVGWSLGTVACLAGTVWAYNQSHSFSDKAKTAMTKEESNNNRSKADQYRTIGSLLGTVAGAGLVGVTVTFVLPFSKSK